jgi:hypothetical protein
MLQREPSHQKLRFILYESDPGIPNHAVSFTQAEANKITRVLTSINFDHITVEKRTLLTDQTEIEKAENNYQQILPLEFRDLLDKDIRYRCIY